MIEVKDVKRLGKLKEDENLRFRQFLKINADEDELDKQFKELHNKYFKIYIYYHSFKNYFKFVIFFLSI